jgi:hypothetical protein
VENCIALELAALRAIAFAIAPVESYGKLRPILPSSLYTTGKRSRSYCLKNSLFVPPNSLVKERESHIRLPPPGMCFPFCRARVVSSTQRKHQHPTSIQILGNSRLFTPGGVRRGRRPSAARHLQRTGWREGALAGNTERECGCPRALHRSVG